MNASGRLHRNTESMLGLAPPEVAYIAVMPMTVIAESKAQNHTPPHIVAHLRNGRSFVIDGPLDMELLPAILAAKSA
jgi:hypothetical protein